MRRKRRWLVQLILLSLLECSTVSLVPTASPNSRFGAVNRPQLSSSLPFCSGSPSFLFAKRGRKQQQNDDEGTGGEPGKEKFWQSVNINARFNDVKDGVLERVRRIKPPDGNAGKNNEGEGKNQGACRPRGGNIEENSQQLEVRSACSARSNVSGVPLPPVLAAGSSRVKRTKEWFEGLSSSVFGPKSQWVDLLPKSRISPGELVPVTVLGVKLLAVAPAPGAMQRKGNPNRLGVYCIENKCPHLGTPLETGRVTLDGSLEKSCITCPLHQSQFLLETGESINDWCPSPPFIGELLGGERKQLPTYQVREKGRMLQVKVVDAIDEDTQKQKQKLA